MNIKFVKRDGSEEKYQEEKIIKVLVAAGLEKNDSKKVAATITSWLTKADSLKINSLQIRTKIIEELRKHNPSVANLFEWYEKSKE